MNSSPNQDAALTVRGKLWNNGFRPVAVYSHDAIHWSGQPIVNRGKRPIGDDWPERARRNPPEAATAKPNSEALNTGVLCDGLIALDVDVDDAAIVAQIAGAAAHYLGNAPSRTRHDSERLLYLYRASEGEPSKRSISGPRGKVEALGCGQQFVAFGNHPSGAAYEWPQGSPDGFHRDALTPVTQDALQAFLCAVAPLVGADVPAQPATSPAALPVASVVGQVTDRDRDYADSVLTAECAKLAAMVAGMGRNNQLNISAHSLGTLVGNNSLDGDIAKRELLRAATANEHVAKHGIAQTEATIKSGLSAGMKKPRPLLALAPHVAAIDVGGIAEHKRKRDKPIPPDSGKRSVTLVQCSAIEPKSISWLWNGFIPQGKLTLLAGAGGTGKSTLAFSFAGTVSNAGTWPDGSQCVNAGNVLIWSSEDDPADTIVPRLMAVGANLQRCGIISGAIDENGLRCPFDAARDMDRLREEINRIGGVSLLIIDPIVTAVTGDMHKANDVRRDLQPIVDFAAETNCAVFGITHFAKGTAGKNSAERVIGSQAFAALARMVLVAAKEEDSQNRVFTRAKSNNSVDTGGFSYTIEAGTLPGGIEATRIAWGEALQGSSREILSTVEEPETDDTSKIGQAKRFILEALSSGPVESKELAKTAREGFGISERTLRRAGEALGIKPKHEPLWGGKWSWALPLSEQLNAAKN